MSTSHDTGHTPVHLEQNAPADVLDQAETIRGDLGDDTTERLHADLNGALAALDNLNRALDELRPAPDPRWLGHQMKLAWFRAVQRRHGGTFDGTAAWTAAAETAIDAVRGLWPPTAPQTVAGGGEGATTSSPDSAVTGAPAPGDTHTSTSASGSI